MANSGLYCQSLFFVVRKQKKGAFDPLTKTESIKFLIRKFVLNFQF